MQRAISLLSLRSRCCEMPSRNWGGRKVSIFGSNFAGVEVMTLPLYFLVDFLDLVRAKLKYLILCSLQQNVASMCLFVPGPASNGSLQCLHVRNTAAPDSFCASCHHSALISKSVVILG